MPKKQKDLPGLERKTVKELDDAAEAYVEARDTRILHSLREKEAKDVLIVVMKKHSLDVYKDAGAALVVTLVPGKDGVKVTEDGGSEEDDAA